MKTTSKVLIDDLTEKTEAVITYVNTVSALPEDKLKARPTDDSWTVLECLEHLNRYADFYIPAMRTAIDNSKHPSSVQYRSYLLGNYFAESMPPRPKLNKMNTFKSKNPMGADLSVDVISRFLKDQEEILQLLQQSRAISLMKTRTATTIASWLTIMLGDTLRVIIYHNERHIEQIKNILAHG